MALMLVVLMASRSYNALEGTISNAFLRYQLMAVFRTAPALLYVVTGYMMMLAVRKAPHFFKKRSVMVLMLLVMALLYVVGITNLEETVILRFFRMGENTLLGIFTGLAGSGMTILAARLLPTQLRLLSKFGRESMHIMVFHFYPFPIKKVITRLYEKLAGPSLCIGSTICIFVVSYVFSVYVFEPACRWLKTRFDAIAR